MLFCWTLLLGMRVCAQSFEPPSPQRFRPEFWAQNLRYSCKYPFVRYERNYWEWKRDEAVAPFFEALLQTDRRKLRVVHIGDSHVQADVYTGHVRNRLQELFGAGGRGMIFPYAAAKTHSAYDYLTFCAGVWDYARNVHPVHKYPVGVSGVTISTTKPGSWVKIVFNEAYRDADSRKLGLLTSETTSDFRLVWPGGDSVISPQTSTTVLTLPVSPKSLEIRVEARNARQTR
ncbi:MAG: hypothetical protein NZ534_13090, partial [Bacteroidia bacterium]|nr:hypothetical protein [Bacteroidia bacterium]